MTYIYIPESVDSIGLRAFEDCSNLSTIISLNPTPPELSSNTFETYSATLKIPVGSKEAYQNAEGWKNFMNMVEIDPSGIENVIVDKDKNTPIYDFNGRKLNTFRNGINIVGGKKYC